MPISLHAQRNRRKKCAGVSPLDPAAERILEMRSGNIAIKKQRASVTTPTEALWVGSSTKKILSGDHCFALILYFLSHRKFTAMNQKIILWVKFGFIMPFATLNYLYNLSLG